MIARRRAVRSLPRRWQRVLDQLEHAIVQAKADADERARQEETLLRTSPGFPMEGLAADWLSPFEQCLAAARQRLEGADSRVAARLTGLEQQIAQLQALRQRLADWTVAGI